MEEKEEKLQQSRETGVHMSALDMIFQKRKEIMEHLMKYPELERAGCLVKRAVNVIIAKNEFTKSLAAFSIAWKETKEGSFSCTTYLDFDNPPGYTFGDRFSKFEILPNFAYISKQTLMKTYTYLSGKTPREKAWAMLEDLANHPPEEGWLIVIDSIENICDYNNFKKFREFFELCRDITNSGSTVLFLHHKNSKTEDISEGGLGYIFDTVDDMWEATLRRNGTGTITNIRLKNLKSRFIEAYKDFIVSVDTKQGTVSYDQSVLFKETIPTKNAIIEYLASHPKANQEVISQAVKSSIDPSFNGAFFRAFLQQLGGLHILKVEQDSNNKNIYSLNHI